MKESIAELLTLPHPAIITASLTLSERVFNCLLSKVRDEDLHVELLAYRRIAEQAEAQDYISHNVMVSRFANSRNKHGW